MQTHVLTFPVDPIPFEIKKLLNGERCFGRSAPSGQSGMGPPPAFGGRRSYKIPPTRLQKLFAQNWYYIISYYKLSFWAAASTLWVLAAAVRARPPAGRARPPPFHIKKALASKWYWSPPPQKL
jgi:hypothetical protein